MGWIAGYHDHFESRHYGHHETWEAARAAVVDELDQRVMALMAEPGPTGDADELAELEEALRYFAELDADEEAVADATALTFVLVPEVADELGIFAEAFGPEVRQ